MKSNFYVKKRFIWIIYILILFTGITFVKKQEKRMSLPVIDLEEVKEEEKGKAEFTIKSIDTVNLGNLGKEYIYKIEVKEELDDSNYSKISAMVLNNIKDKEDFEKLSLEIIKDNKTVFTFEY